MVNQKSPPPNRTAGRRPLDSIDSLSPSSLPPELGSLDMSWDDDPNSVATIDLLQHSDYDLDVEAGERTTAVPQIPMEELVQATMAEADAKESADSQRGTGQPLPKAHSPVAPPRQTPVPQPQRERSRYGEHRAQIQTQPAPARSVDVPLMEPTTSGAGCHIERGTVESRRTDATAESDDARSDTPYARSSRAPRSVGGRMSAPPTVRNAELENLRHQMKDRYATGDFSGALALAESLLEGDRDDLEAQRFATSCRDVLTQMLASRLGTFAQVVVIALSQEELRWLTLDHRAGFLLSLVDGCSTIEELLDISGMARLESLRILSTLIEQRVVRLVSR